jgi:hypothetical protein
MGSSLYLLRIKDFLRKGNGTADESFPPPQGLETRGGNPPHLELQSIAVAGFWAPAFSLRSESPNRSNAAGVAESVFPRLTDVEAFIPAWYY